MEISIIDKWDHLVCIDLHPVKLKNVLPVNGVIDSFQGESKEAKDRARLYIVRESLLRKSREENTVLIEQIQAFFSNLLHVIYQYQSEPGLPLELQNLYEQVGSDLESLIYFLETSFRNYFNYQYPVPHLFRSKFETGIKTHLSKFKKSVVEIEKNQRLIESVFDILENFIQSPGSEEINFHQLNYFKNLVAVFSSWEAANTTDRKISPLVELMIALKFNEEGFLNLVFRLFRESLATTDSEEDPFKLLKEYYKNVSQVLESKSPAFFPDQPSPKEILLDWLSQEIYFWETCFPKKEITAAGASTASTEKIHTSLSVPVLALYIRLFKESGIITNANSQELFRAVSSSFTTNRKAEVAHSHLHSKYYAIEESAKRKVFDQLMGMAHLCKRLG